ncbi:MAG: lytic murein transglycosylase, partial [Hyphomicrobiales bacterium]|nr:lytic murein transglycosylase [Hyphomicrobiales bacterium]
MRPRITAFCAACALCLTACVFAPRSGAGEALAKSSAASVSIAVAASPSSGATKNPASFAAFIEALWPKAKAAGVSRETFDAAFAGVQLDPTVLERTKKQAEFERTIPDYLASAVSEQQVEQGRALVA